MSMASSPSVLANLPEARARLLTARGLTMETGILRLRQQAIRSREYGPVASQLRRYGSDKEAMSSSKDAMPLRSFGTERSFPDRATSSLSLERSMPTSR